MILNHIQVKNYFDQTYNMSVQQVKFPLMNRMWELWGIDGWANETFVRS